MWVKTAVQERKRTFQDSKGHKYRQTYSLKCGLHSFALPTPGFEKYQRATQRFKEETIAGLIEDNSTLPRIAERLNRVFNTTGSKSTIDRWKHKEADRYSFKDIISRLEFSSILCIDEYKPRRAKTYDLIASDAIKNRILYLENLAKVYSARAVGSVGRGHVEDFALRLKEFGINPYAVIFDLSTVFPKQIKRVWPYALIQFDYFHIIKIIYGYLKNAIKSFRIEIKDSLPLASLDIWEHKWRIIKNLENLSLKEHQILEELIWQYRGTLIEKALIFKEQVRDIFNLSKNKQEAYQRRDELIKDTYWQSSYHLSRVVEFLSSWKFEYMITYLEYPNVPRSGNSESCVRIWRQMEKVRYGLTAKGRQDHLKLYQIRTYLNEKI